MSSHTNPEAVSAGRKLYITTLLAAGQTQFARALQVVHDTLFVKGRSPVIVFCQ